MILIKEELMESETLFKEEEEPPGHVTGLVHAKNNVSDFLLFKEEFSQYPIKQKSDSTLFPFKDSARSRIFRTRLYPEITRLEWFDWHWQLRNAIRDVDTLSEIINLSDNERQAMMHHSGALPVSITPYYASLLNPNDPADPLRRCVVPVVDECLHTKGEEEDPLCEDVDSPVPGIIHRYPDRVLFLVTGFCSAYCRYCTRSHMVAKDKCHIGVHAWEPGLQYIQQHPEIRDVLVSGGDPLTMSDQQIEYLLARLRAIEHVEIIRIGTKVPAVLPQRITRSLVTILRKYHPLYISIHFTHPEEITPEVKDACEKLANAGIPLGSQTVLLKGINDDVTVMKKLMQGLLKIRVRPYYLYQCDPILGSTHFRTPIAKGLEIIRGLRGHTTGYAVPQYVVDAPGGGGKIPLLPDYFQGREDDYVLLKNFEGNIFKYPDFPENL